MGIKENGKAHFKAKLAGDLLCIDVPEWGGKIYHRAAINGVKQGQILALYEKGKIVDSVCMSLIMRALDEDGNAIWRPAELGELMRQFDTEVISRVVEQMADAEIGVDEAKKQ